MILKWLYDSSTSLLKVLTRQALGMTRVFMSTGVSWSELGSRVLCLSSFSRIKWGAQIRENVIFMKNLNQTLQYGSWRDWIDNDGGLKTLTVRELDLVWKRCTVGRIMLVFPEFVAKRGFKKAGWEVSWKVWISF